MTSSIPCPPLVADRLIISKMLIILGSICAEDFLQMADYKLLVDHRTTLLPAEGGGKLRVESGHGVALDNLVGGVEHIVDGNAQQEGPAGGSPTGAPLG